MSDSDTDSRKPMRDPKLDQGLRCAPPLATFGRPFGTADGPSRLRVDPRSVSALRPHVPCRTCYLYI